MLHKFKKIVFVAIASLFFIPTLANADDISMLTDDQYEMYKDIGGNLRCPTCTGLSVLQSEAEFSVQIRDAVKEQIKLGKSHEEIMFFFKERYGLWIFREPPKEGVHLLAWGVPLGVVLIGGYLIWAFVWRKRKKFASHGSRSSSEIVSEMETRLGELRGKA